MRKLVTVSLAALSIACGGDSTELKPTIAGTWTGIAVAATLTLTLQQAGTQVTGNGSLTGPGGSAALTVTGSYTAPSFSLTLDSPGYTPLNYAGTVNGKTMVGTLNGTGVTNVSVTLTRP